MREASIQREGGSIMKHLTTSRRFFIPFVVAVVGLAGCFNLDGDGSESTVGLAPTLPSKGAQIVFDPIIEGEGEIPVVPLPSDLLTRSCDSPTGRCLNVSVTAGQAQFEENLRDSMDRRDGFGTFAPIWFSVELPNESPPAPAEGYGPTNPDPKPVEVEPILNLSTITNDTVFLFQLEDCEQYPKGTRFPLSLPDPKDPHKDATGIYVKKLQTAMVGEQKGFYVNDFRSATPDMFFDQEIDWDGDGACSFDEDINHDGLCNFRGNRIRDKSGNLQYVDWYDIRNHITGYDTVILRPLYVLDEQCEYAVVLTRDILDKNGLPLRSPFEYVNHTAQTEALKPLLDILPQYGLKLEDIAFTWSFTTGTQTKVIEELIRGGMYGEGAFSFLHDEFPPQFTEIAKLKGETLAQGRGTGQGNAYLFKPEAFAPVALILGGAILESFSAGLALVQNLLMYTDYIVFGSFNTADFLTSEYRPDQPIEDAAIIFDYRNGTDLQTAPIKDLSQAQRIRPGEQDVPFICLIPKERPEEGITPPFPVIFYGHGYTSGRIENLGFGANFNRHGFASCTMCAAQHCPQDDFKDLRGLVSDLGLVKDAEGNDLGLGSDEEALQIVPELLRQLVVGDDNDVCQEVYGEDCNQVTAEEALNDIDQIEGLLTDLLCKGIETPPIDAVVQLTDLISFSSVLGLPEIEESCDIVEKILPLLGDEPYQVVTRLSELALKAVKLFFRWQASVYCTDVDNPSDIPLETDIGDMIEHIGGCTVFKELGTKGRARVLNSKGESRGGGDYWVANTFHTTAVVTQTLYDQAAFVHAILNCDPNKGVLGGDFNLDGVCDMAGPFYATGSSLGGISSMMQCAAIPEIEGCYPSSGAAGLPDVAVRTFQGGVWEAVYGELICSPCIFGRMNADQYEIGLTWSDVNEDVISDSEYFDSTFAQEMSKARIVIKNLTNGDESTEYAFTDGRFRGSVRSDKGDTIKVEIFREDGTPLWEKEYLSPVKGFGFSRGSEGLLRFLNIAYHIVSPADPANYAVHNFTANVPTGDPWGFVIHNRRGALRSSDAGVVNLISVGDSNVPVNTGINYGRIMGAFDWDFTQTLIKNGAYNGAVGPAFVSASTGKICMDGTTECVSTVGNDGDLCRDDDGNPEHKACFNLYAWMPDPVPIPDADLSGEEERETDESGANEPAPNDCVPSSDSSAMSVCGTSVAYAPQADGSLQLITSDVSNMPGPLAPLEWGTTHKNDADAPVQASARFALMSCKENWHGIEPSNPDRIIEECPGGDIPFDWGTYETGRMAYFFRTGQMRDDACFENDSCAGELDDYVPPEEVDLQTVLEWLKAIF